VGKRQLFFLITVPSQERLMILRRKRGWGWGRYKDLLSITLILD
jgi:hypothetical protein